MSDEQDMLKMGGLASLLPFTYAMMFIGSLSLIVIIQFKKLGDRFSPLRPFDPSASSATDLYFWRLSSFYHFFLYLLDFNASEWALWDRFCQAHPAQGSSWQAYMAKAALQAPSLVLRALQHSAELLKPAQKQACFDGSNPSWVSWERHTWIWSIWVFKDEHLHLLHPPSCVNSDTFKWEVRPTDQAVT